MIVFFKFTKANNEYLVINNDSLVIENIIEVKDSFIDNKEVAKEEIEGNNVTFKKNLKSKKLATKPADFGTFLNNFWDIISSPFKPVWGYYEEDDYNKEGPCFLFMNDNNKLNL